METLVSSLSLHINLQVRREIGRGGEVKKSQEFCAAVVLVSGFVG